MKHLLLFVLLLIAAINGSAQRLSDFYNVTSTERISCIAHSGDMLYVATRGGLLLYDTQSSHTEVLRHADSGIGDNELLYVTEGPSGMWALGKNYGIDLINDSGITHYELGDLGISEPLFIPTCLLEDDDHSLWLGGLFYLFHITASETRQYTTPKSYVSNDWAPYTMLRNKEGELMIGGMDQWGEMNFCMFSEQEDRIITLSKAFGSVYMMAQDSQGHIWMATDDGVVEYDGTQYHQFVEGTKIMALAVDENDDVWFSLGMTLYKLPKGEPLSHWTIPNETIGFISVLHCLNGSVYAGTTYDGLFCFSNEKFMPIADPSSYLGNDYATAGCLDDKGNYWTANNRMVYAFSAEGEAILSFAQPNNTDYYVKSFATDKDGGVWLNYQSNDTCLLIIRGEEIQAILYSEMPFTKGLLINEMAFDDQNRLWLATESGLGLYDGESWKKFTSANSGLKSDGLSCLAFDSKGNVWCGASVDGNSGLYCFDGTTWKNYNKTKNPLPMNYVISIAIDSQDRIWMGTGYIRNGNFVIGKEYGGGLTRFNGTNWKTWNINNSDLPSNTIMDIAIDEKDNLWLATHDHVGLTIFDGIDEFVSHNVSNSGLAHNEIKCISLDTERHRAWINHMNYYGMTGFKYDYSGETIEIVQNDTEASFSPDLQLFLPQGFSLKNQNGRNRIVYLKK